MNKEPKDTDILDEANLIVDIILGDPRVGVILANTIIAMGEALVMAGSILEQSPLDKMANELVTIATELGLIKMDEDDGDDVTLSPSDVFRHALESVHAIVDAGDVSEELEAAQ
jgi:hypothetical protein